MAEAFASGHLQPTSALVPQVPWPDATRTFTPGDSSPRRPIRRPLPRSARPDFHCCWRRSSPLAVLDALFWVTPLAGALLVWMAFLAGRALGGPLAGAMAAVLIAVSPPVLYQVVQPMNDITTAALWMATFVALIAPSLGPGGRPVRTRAARPPELAPARVGRRAVRRDSAAFAQASASLAVARTSRTRRGGDSGSGFGRSRDSQSLRFRSRSSSCS